jgi:uncharacterized protein GlcG (DUF336 family)
MAKAMGAVAAFAAMMMFAGAGRAQEALVTYRALSLDTALELAQGALKACRDLGYQVTVAVVDRSGLTQVVLRDRFAGPHTVPTAIGKGWTAVSFRANTSQLLQFSGPGMPQSGIRELPNVVIIGGGMVVEAGGAIVGAVGVSGAPGGPEDDKCAQVGIEAVRAKLEF